MKLTFTSSLDSQGLPVSYSVDGDISHDGEIVPIGFASANFNRAFDELRYWVHLCPSAQVDFKTITA